MHTKLGFKTKSLVILWQCYQTDDPIKFSSRNCEKFRFPFTSPDCEGSLILRLGDKDKNIGSRITQATNGNDENDEKDQGGEAELQNVMIYKRNIQVKIGKCKSLLNICDWLDPISLLLDPLSSNLDPFYWIHCCLIRICCRWIHCRSIWIYRRCCWINCHGI